MKNILIISQLIHKISMLVLLISIAVIPLMIEVDLTVMFVLLPLILIISFSTSLMIEHQLIKLTAGLAKKHKQKTINNSKCVIKKGFHCLHNCLHS